MYICNTVASLWMQLIFLVLNGLARCYLVRPFVTFIIMTASSIVFKTAVISCLFMQPACKHHHEHADAPQMAKEYYLEAVQTSENVEKILADLPASDLQKDIIERIKNWEESVIAMDGMPHVHRHSAHKHDHSEKMKLSAQDLIKVQKEWHDSIKAIASDLGNILSQISQ